MLASLNTAEGLSEKFQVREFSPLSSTVGSDFVKHSVILGRLEKLCGLTLSVIDPVE